MIVDRELVLQAEDAIAAERSAFAEGMAALHPKSGACWLPIAGGRAIFTGAEFFTNRVMAMGLRGPVNRNDVERAESFYAEHNLPAEIELASGVDRSLLGLLGERGYRLIRFRNVYVKAVGSTEPVRDGVAKIHEVGASRFADWSTTLLDGFGYTTEVDRSRVETWNRMLSAVPELTALVAVLDEKAIGSASMMILGSTAVLGGAATLPAFRRRGVQQQLIKARLAVAFRAGCKLAVVTADPGSSSGRNAERTGFQLLCNHANMRSLAK